MATPSTQKAGDRPITFYLYDRRNGVNLERPFTLAIRPEELTRAEPSRVTVLQTLGGAWADDFGRGVATINISGHTGWRGSLTEDGSGLFLELRRRIYERWHEERANRRARGEDPDTVELIFADSLDDICAVVVPTSFQLRRNKNRPLLMQYSIQMSVLREADAPAIVEDFLTATDPSRGQVPETAVNAINRAAAEQLELAQAIRDAFEPAAQSLAAMTEKSAALLTAVTDIVASGVSIYDAFAAPVIYTAMQVQQASRNIAMALVTPLALTERHRQTMMQLSASFNEAYCNLRNNFPVVRRYFDFTALFGASNCSSTSGGRPPSAFYGQNPFLVLYPTSTGSAKVTRDGVAALQEAGADVLALAGNTKSENLAYADRVASGLEVGAVQVPTRTDAGNPFERLEGATRRVDTQRGDSLQRIAARELGDASRWPELAAINNLAYPFITDDPALASDRVLLTGGSMVVPATGPAAQAKTAADPVSTFGIDIALTGGELEADEDGDLKLISGYKNLSQALKHRIDTRMGELLFHPDYGCGVHDIVGQGASASNVRLAAALVRRALAADNRVASARSVTASLTGDVLSVAGTAVAVDDTRVPVEV